MIEAVIFDLGNVLIDFDHRRAAGKLFGFTDKSAQEMYDLFFDSGLTALFEEGKIAPREFFLKVRDELSLSVDYDKFVPIWNEVFFLSAKNISVHNTASSLKKRYKVALLSNTNILHFEYIKKTFPILDAFHNIVTSYEAGVRKPDPVIYQKTLEILKTPAQNVFYTDDRPELVEASRRLGIQGVVFKGVDQLKKDLTEAGICAD